MVATPTRRRLILEALVARVEAIKEANGFETDAGESVHLGETPALGDDDPDQAISMVPGADEPKWSQHGKGFQIGLPIAFHAVAKASLEPKQAFWLIESLIGDIKRAVELEDRTLGGLLAWPMERGSVEGLPREPGSLTVGAAVNYTVIFKEGWGNP